MLAQVLAVQGAEASTASFVDAEPARIRQLPLDTRDTAVVGFLNADSLKHGRFLVRRLKRAKPSLRVGIVLWSDEAPEGDPEAVARELNADFVAFDLAGAATGALADTPAIPAQGCQADGPPPGHCTAQGVRKRQGADLMGFALRRIWARSANASEWPSASQAKTESLPWRALQSVGGKMVLPERIELSTSPLPRECSTTELRQRP